MVINLFRDREYISLIWEPGLVFPSPAPPSSLPSTEFGIDYEAGSCASKRHNFLARKRISKYTCIWFLVLCCIFSWLKLHSFLIHPKDHIQKGEGKKKTKNTHQPERNSILQVQKPLIPSKQIKSIIITQIDQRYLHYHRIHLKWSLIYILLFQKLRKQFL